MDGPGAHESQREDFDLNHSVILHETNHTRTFIMSIRLPGHGPAGVQESLGGNAKTSMIIAVSDVKEHSDETLQSLLFGSRAILVRTEARVNQFIDLSAINEQIAAQLEVRSRLPATARWRAAVPVRMVSDVRSESLQGIRRLQRSAGLAWQAAGVCGCSQRLGTCTWLVLLCLLTVQQL